jgi:UDP-glucuronate 4-epimerase
MKILVTGAAGFIGMHVARQLLERGDEVFGIDNLNEYYDQRLKHARLEELTHFPNFRFDLVDVADKSRLGEVFASFRPEKVVHLAAQAGVRHSLKHPDSYVQSNLVGFVNILEVCRHCDVQHLVYASSSSVYGGNTKVPFSVTDNVDHPLSLYAATKKSNELLAYAYSSLFGIPMTGLRFFTVYGPWGRPDMSPWLFTSAILEGRTIDVFNHGNMLRDFTFIDDIVEGTVRVMDRYPEVAAPMDQPPYKVYNIGNQNPVLLLEFISTLENILGKPAEKRFLPMQPGDSLATSADVTELTRDVGYTPKTPLHVGLQRWADWYRQTWLPRT